MPVYEYECELCGERFERLVRSMKQDPPGLACPACRGTEVRRLISAPVVHSGGEGSGGSQAEEAPAPKPPVFGRKELNEALKSKS
jgi:putative FmdB family regulatory protein